MLHLSFKSRIVHYKRKEMKDKRFKFGPFNKNNDESGWNWLDWANETNLFNYEKTIQAYDFLLDYSQVFNQFSANTPQPNPFSNKAMYIIDILNSLGVKYSLDIFTYEGNKLNWGTSNNSHKLLNIIAEPNPEATGPAIVFCAHHDVNNVRSENCQDNGASVCNLLRLSNLIKQSKESHQRVIILFADCEEFGARGSKRFAKQSIKIKDSTNIKHNIYGEISGVVNLELTGLGDVIWSDLKSTKVQEQDKELHNKLEAIHGGEIKKLFTPPSDVISFREYDYPALCIGTLPEEDLQEKKTWSLCHRMEDVIQKCNRKNMEDFTRFLFNITKNQNNTTEHGTIGATNQTAGPLQI